MSLVFIEELLLIACRRKVDNHTCKSNLEEASCEIGICRLLRRNNVSHCHRTQAVKISRK